MLAGAGSASHRFRLDDPWLDLAGDAAGEDTLSGWSTDEDDDTLAALAVGEFGASLRRLTAPGIGPLAVPGGGAGDRPVRSGSGGLRLMLARWPAGPLARWPAGLRGTAASGPAGGVVRHGVAYAGPGEACGCARHECGGVVPVSWCPQHGNAVEPVMEWHPGGGIRCTALSTARSAAVGQTARAAIA
ncbi:hypothetical protein ACFV60_37910 [Streptomyces virginiae]|uniref:hypothetical protein n=1 Tax=Streptomyces virginiae TaxID=1961 RepID=UPI00365A6D9C